MSDIVIPTDLFPEVETGEIAISLNNVVKEIKMNDAIYGVIHRISPFGEHSTLIFHMNGYVWEAVGFHLGQVNKNNIHNVIGLAWVLNMIPFLSPFIQGDYLKKKAPKEELKECKEKTICINYIWRPPVGELIPMNFSDCDGALTMDKYIQEIAEDSHSSLSEDHFNAE